MAGFTISALLAAWLKAAGTTKEVLDDTIDGVVADYPDLAGPAEEVKARIASGLEAAGLTPDAAAALALKAYLEIRTGTAGRNPNAFGIGG